MFPVLIVLASLIGASYVVLSDGGAA